MNLTLTPEQQAAIEAIDSGRNVFLTGVAGTGKTTALNHWLENTDRKVAITASTGIAATHIGGQTLHSWIKASPHVVYSSQLCTEAWGERHGPRLAAVDCLVIDEVSMVDGRLFTLAERAHAFARKSDKAWGGMQVVLVGDIGQLPPVEEERYGWFFNCRSWAESAVHVAELTVPLRQSDAAFTALLQNVRMGQVSYEVYETLNERRDAFDPVERGAVRLMTHNVQVDEVNAEHLQKLPKPERCYRSNDMGVPYQVQKLDKRCLSPANLVLREGARVMFTRNDQAGRWVNGTLGTVRKLGKKGKGPTVEVDGGEEHEVDKATWTLQEWSETGDLTVVAERTQYPLRLAWAITIHKSQGMTIDPLSVNIAESFAPGQAYVALSRARSLEGLNIEDWQPSAIKCSRVLAGGT